MSNFSFISISSISSLNPIYSLVSFIIKKDPQTNIFLFLNATFRVSFIYPFFTTLKLLLILYYTFINYCIFIALKWSAYIK